MATNRIFAWYFGSMPQSGLTIDAAAHVPRRQAGINYQFAMRWASAGAIVAASGLAVSQPDSTLGAHCFLSPSKAIAACRQYRLTRHQVDLASAPLVSIKSQYRIAPDCARYLGPQHHHPIPSCRRTVATAY
jgi:hypothetical protein